MSGVKGRSGRRPRGIEQKRLDTIDKAWRLVDEILSSEKPEKYQIAKDLVLRTAPQEVKGEGFASRNYIITKLNAGNNGDGRGHTDSNPALERQAMGLCTQPS